MRAWLLLFLSVGAVLYGDPYEAYRRGERATNLAEARAAFHEALEGFAEQSAVQAQPKLLFNMANCYFQLGEVPTAIVYYRRALQLAPRDRLIRTNLCVALERAGVATLVRCPFSLGGLLSPRERIWVTTGFGLCGSLLLSFWMWRRYRSMRLLGLLCHLAALFCIGGLLFEGFLAAPEAVVMQAALMRKDAGESYAPVSALQPLLAGSSVKVLEEKEGWLRVCLRDGKTSGYIPADRVVLLR